MPNNDWQMRRDLPGFIFDLSQQVSQGKNLPFQRKQYGYDPRLKSNVLNNLRRQSNMASQAFVNQAGATTPMNVAARLNRFKQGAQLGGQIYQQGALPFAMNEQGFAEGQRATDIGLGMQARNQQQGLLQFLMQFLQNKNLSEQAQKGFGINTPFGGFST